ncbi:pentapeptide repeat-containing protein, partial [Candidatus Desantisbacteria bacterium]|nr:pentapeptide repeat-containing protein [Candidatus Desantisbacteria bacterium]
DEYCKYYKKERYINALVKEKKWEASLFEQEHGNIKSVKIDQDALDALFRWLENDDYSYCAILGDYGIGKTFLSRMFARELLQKRKQNPELPLPLYIDLRHINTYIGDRIPTAEEMIDSILKKNGVRDVKPEIVIELVRQGDIIIIFDGLDEKTVHLQPAQANKFIEQIQSILPNREIKDKSQESDIQKNKKYTYQGKLLIACRTHYFRDHREEKNMLTGGRRTGRRSDDFLVYYLKPFNEDQIKLYLEKIFGIERRNETWELINRIHNLADLSERPYLLSLITEHLGDLKRKTDEGQEDWVDNEVDSKYKISYENILRMTIESDIRTSTFLIRDGNNNFRFAHTSLQEFFIARYVVRGLSSEKPEVFDLPLLSIETRNFIIGLLELKEELVDKTNFSKTLISIIEAEYVSQRSENAFALIISCKKSGISLDEPKSINLEGANLETWELSDLNLEYANFKSANLKNVIIKNSNLSNANLYNANLSNSKIIKSNFEKAVMEKTDLTRIYLKEVFLEGAIFEKANLQASEFIKCKMNNANLKNVNLKYSSFGLCEFENVDFTDTCIWDAETGKSFYIILFSQKEWAVFKYDKLSTYSSSEVIRYIKYSYGLASIPFEAFNE